MLSTLKLLFPALAPSWNFFDDVAPSPRIEFVLLNSKSEQSDDWREFRPRPQSVSFITMMRRLLWNPRWNETLFLVSCSERLQNQLNPHHSENEIFTRMVRDIRASMPEPPPFLQFRLVFVYREDDHLEREVTFLSAPRAMTEAMA